MWGLKGIVMATEKETEGADKFAPITSQEQLNTVISERIERAKKTAVEPFTDYDDLKTKAAQYDQSQNDKKSADEKNAESIAALQKQLVDSESARQRVAIQAKYKISDEHAERFLTATNSEALETQAKDLAEILIDRKSGAPYVPEQKDIEPRPADDDDGLRSLVQSWQG